MFNGSITQELLTAARIIGADSNHFSADGKYYIPKPDIVTEYWVGNWFQAVCNHKLDKYPQTLKVN